MRAFSKYEGLGNDFVLLDAAVWPHTEVTPALAVALCNRHTGVGGDGIVWVNTAEAPGRVRMVIYNADGSRPEMCGNGVRCVAAWLADTGRLPVDGTVVVDSDAGPRAATVVSRQGATVQVTVDMGAATLHGVVTATDAAGPTAVEVMVVDVGNPHGVVFGTHDPDAVVRAVTRLREFPDGVNVELVTQTPQGFRVRVHERGVGWTQACGTGACAVAAAAVARGLAAPDQAVTVTLDGGDLAVVVSAHGGRVQMAGPARRVFAGTLSG